MSDSISPTTSSTPVPTPTTPADETDLQQEVQALRTFVVKLQSALIALTWIFGVFVFIQFWRARGELAVVRPQAAQIIEIGKRKEQPINQFVVQLAEYGRAHADFAPIITKYGISAPGATSPPAATPVPATTPKPVGTAPAPVAPPKK